MPEVTQQLQQQHHSQDNVHTVRKLLKEWTLLRYLDHVKREPIITLHNDTLLGDALQVLYTKKVLSAPVLDYITGEFMGFYSISDSLSWLLKGLFPQLLDRSLNTGEAMSRFLQSPDAPSDKLMKIEGWAREGFLVEFVLRPGDRPNRDGDTLYRGFGETTMLDLVSEGLQCPPKAKDLRGYADEPCHHRVAVFEPVDAAAEKRLLETARSGPRPMLPQSPRRALQPPFSTALRITSVISQSDVVRLIVWHKDTFPTLGTSPPFSLPVESLIGPFSAGSPSSSGSGVVTVPSTLPTIAAFAVMHNAGVSGVAVVDPGTGELLGNLSVSDLRCLCSPNDFDLLTLPVLEFSRLRASATNNDNMPPESIGADQEGLVLDRGSAGPAAAMMQVDTPQQQRLPGTRAGAEHGQGESEAAAQGGGTAVIIGRGLPGGGGEAHGVAAGVAKMTVEQEQGGPPVVACAPDETLMTVMERMVERNLHRIYVVRDRKPVGVITLTDILRLFAVDPRSPAAGEWLTWAQQQAPVAAEQEKRGVEETREALLGRTVAAGEGAGA